MSAHSSFRHDVSSLRRRLSRRPGDLLIPVLTLAIVIGLGASVFAVVNGTMLRPLPFPDEERLVRVFTLPPGATDTRSRNPLASIDFVRFSERSRSLDRLEVIWQRERGLVGVGDPTSSRLGASHQDSSSCSAAKPHVAVPSPGRRTKGMPRSPS